jgi:hypothetical protein
LFPSVPGLDTEPAADTESKMAKKPAAKAPAADTESKADAKLVRMVRDADAYPAPHSADVHPDEVENFAAGGWVKE